MFTSISRSRSRVGTSYICSSCLNNILSTTTQSPGHKRDLQPFSTSHEYLARITSKSPRESQENKPISEQQGLLEALKQDLIADTKASASKTAVKDVKQTKSPSKTQASKATEDKKPSTNAGPTTPTKSTKAKVKAPPQAAGLAKSKKVKAKSTPESSEAPRAAKSAKSATKVTKSGNGKEPVIPNKDDNGPLRSAIDRREVPLAENRKTFKYVRSLSPNGKRKLTARKPLKLVRRTAIELTKPRPNETSEDRAARIERVTAAIARERRTSALIDIIESGDVSPSAVNDAIRKLRQTLAGSKTSGKPKVLDHNPQEETSNLKTTIKNKIAAYESIKDSIQGRASKQATSKSPPARQSARPSAKAKTVATGPMKGKGFEVKRIAADELHLTPVDKAQEPVPKLSYGLERVLFNPGVYHLQDPRSRVFNFDPYLQTIMPVNEFDFNALKQYITSSRDDALLSIAKEEKRKYTGSTSSMTAAMAHFHFLLSQWRPITTGMLSRNFPIEHETFTALQRSPSAVFLRYKNGTYAIDADKQYDTANILSMLGKSMEKLLTLPTGDFEKYRRENSDQILEEERNEAETFHYTTMGDFLMRSQLDAYDPRLPGTGMFDLKTRAVVSIRMDVKEYESGMGYEIRRRHGEWESYEREYYDMIRAAFLKYSLQVRMGRMDGIFVAFHNTERIFGFQYISLSEMDYALHGTEDTTTGDSEFKMSLELLNQLLNRATEKFPEKSLRLHFETRPGDTPFMYMFAEPMEEAQIDEIQTTNRAAVLEFENSVLGMGNKTEEELLEMRRTEEWDSLRAKVEESIEKDELDVMDARTVAENVIRESKYWDNLPQEEKRKRIDELINSIEFQEDNGNERHDGVPIDNEEENGVEEEEEEDGDSMDEDDVNEEEEMEPESSPNSGVSHEVVEELTSNESFTKDEVDVNDIQTSVPETGEHESEGAIDGNAGVDEPSSIKEDKPVADEAASPDQPLLSDEALEEYIRAKLEDVKTSKDVQAKDVDTEQGEQIEDKTTAEDGPPLPDEGSVKSTTPAETDSESTTSESSSDSSGPSLTSEEKEGSEPEILAMTLTIRNIFNGAYVPRTYNLIKGDKWTVEYAIITLPSDRGQTVYEACKRRRQQALTFEKKETAKNWNSQYLEKLKRMSRKGKQWRMEQDKQDAAAGIKRLDILDGEPVEIKDDWAKPDVRNG